MAKAVEFVNINKRFPGVHVLKDISFSVEEGEVLALLGKMEQENQLCLIFFMVFIRNMKVK